MQAQTKEYWRELCERAVNEQDPARFLTVIREINTLLELKRGRFKQTGPQLVGAEPQLARCSLCDKPVILEASKTDEGGQAVHEEMLRPQLAIEEAHKEGRGRTSIAGNPEINQKVSRTKQ